MLEWIPFVSSYPVWVRIVFLIWLVAGIGILGVFVFTPRIASKDKTTASPNIQVNESMGDQKEYPVISQDD